MSIYVLRVWYCLGSMTIVALLYVLSVVFLRKKYSAKSFYYMGILVLIGFIIPIRPAISITAFSNEKTNRNVIEAIENRVPKNEKAENEITIKKIHLFALQRKDPFPIMIVCTVWGIGMAGMLLYYGIRHANFVRTVGRWSDEVTDRSQLNILDEEKKQFSIESPIALKVCACISSPMLISLLHPVILLPDINFSEGELRLVLGHELIHFKRKDLWWRSALILAISMNWFNPAIRVFSKVFTCVCEEACDETVAQKMSEDFRWRYALTIVRMAGEKPGLNTAFSTFFYGGKESMKNRITFIINPVQKRFSIALAAFFIVLIVSTGTVFAASENIEEPLEESSWELLGIKSQEEIDREMAEAFSEVFDNEFNEDNFPGMIITYDEDGIPIVTDPNIPQHRAVFASGRYEKNGFYSSSECDSSSLVFYILKGQKVEVTDSAYTTTVAKVKYAGSTGYMKKAELKF